MWPPQAASLPGWVASGSRTTGLLGAPRSSQPGPWLGEGGAARPHSQEGISWLLAPWPHSWLTDEPTPPRHPSTPVPSCRPHLVTWATPRQEPELAAKARGQRAEAGPPREGRGHLSWRAQLMKPGQKSLARASAPVGMGLPAFGTEAVGITGDNE